MTLPTPRNWPKLADLSIRLYPEYLSTVEALSGRSVRLRTQAAISTDERRRDQRCHERAGGPEADTRVSYGGPVLSLGGGSEPGSTGSLRGSSPGSHRGRGGFARRHGSACGAEPRRTRSKSPPPAGTVSCGRFCELFRGMGGGNSASGPATASRLPGSSHGRDRSLPSGWSLRSIWLMFCVLRRCTWCLAGVGNIVVGATVERVGFDRRVDPLTIRTAASPGSGAVAPDRFRPGGGKLDRASAGYQRRAAGDRKRRTARIAGWRRDTFVMGSCWRRPRARSCASCCRADRLPSGWRLSLPDARLSDKIQSAAL